MSEKKIRRVLASIAIAMFLGLTVTASGNASETSRWRQGKLRGVEAADHLPAFDLWSLLQRIWTKSGARIDPNGAKSGARIDPNGSKSGARIDPNGRPAQVLDQDGEH